MQIFKMVERMRIGTLPEGEQTVVTDDPYASEPSRTSSLIVRSEKPFNAETPMPSLIQHITPEGEHYVRNHMPAPDVVPHAYALQVRSYALLNENVLREFLRIVKIPLAVPLQSI
jgi:sulfite oxidase